VKIGKADTEAGPGKRDFVTANTLLDAVITDLGNAIKKGFVDDVAPKIKALKDKKSTFVATDVADIETLQKEVEADVASRDWARYYSPVIG